MSVINNLPQQGVRYADSVLESVNNGFYRVFLENGERATLANCVPLGISCVNPAGTANYIALFYTDTSVSGSDAQLGARIISASGTGSITFVTNAGNVRFVFAYIPK